MAKKKHILFDPSGLLEQKESKSPPEKDLGKSGGGGKASRRDLRALIKTLWAIHGTLEALTAALVAAKDKLEDQVNRQ